MGSGRPTIHSTARTAAYIAAILCGALSAFAVASAAVTPPDSLVKASGPAVYYYAADGKRYVFPTEGVYDSWFSDPEKGAS